MCWPAALLPTADLRFCFSICKKQVISWCVSCLPYRERYDFIDLPSYSSCACHCLHWKSSVARWYGYCKSSNNLNDKSLIVKRKIQKYYLRKPLNLAKGGNFEIWLTGEEIKSEFKLFSLSYWSYGPVIRAFFGIWVGHAKTNILHMRKQRRRSASR